MPAIRLERAAVDRDGLLDGGDVTQEFRRPHQTADVSYRDAVFREHCVPLVRQSRLSLSQLAITSDSNAALPRMRLSQDVDSRRSMADTHLTEATF